MNTTAFRRIGAVAGAVAVVTTITTPAAANVEEGNEARPCFMVRSHWNNAEGPQPTCPNGRFEEAAADQVGASRPTQSDRVADFMP